MNSFEKLGTQVEELDNHVNSKIKMEDDLSILKEQVDRLDAYVYNRKYHSAKDEQRKLQYEEPLSEEGEFMRGKVEKATKGYEESYFAQKVKNRMTLDEKKKAKIMKSPIQPKLYVAEKVKPRPFKNVSEEVMKATEKRALKDAAGFEQAEKSDLANLEGQVEVPASEVVVEVEETDAPTRGTGQKQFRRAAQVLTLTQDMERSQQERMLLGREKIRDIRAARSREDTEDEPQLSAESFEILASPSQKLSVECPKFSPTLPYLPLMFGESTQDLKEKVALHVKTCLKQMEIEFMVEMHTVKTSVLSCVSTVKDLEEELAILKNSLNIAEVRLNMMEGILTAVEKRAHSNSHRYDEMMICINKKADHSDEQCVTRRDLGEVERRLYGINEKTIEDFEELKKCSKDYFYEIRVELDQKVYGFEMTDRLKNLAVKLKAMEKKLGDVYQIVKVLELQSMGPINVSRYRHCEDGRRIKPLQRPFSLPSIRLPEPPASQKMPIYGDSIDQETVAKLETALQKSLFDAVMRES